ncbi:hypothetical protein EDD21DRAFT_87667 [Dissophora ornata]|nr:hypothetical protein EDD21DRAFT_87667 [Dissophora ornata]
MALWKGAWTSSHKVDYRHWGYTPGERERLKDYRRSTLMMTVDKTREHIEAIRRNNLEPRNYRESGYALRGSVRTDGFRFQLLAFKLNELNAVKYRRLPEDKLPSRIASTLGGTDYFLAEVRNVVKAKQDVSDLWECDPNEIKILGLDLGQAFVIGASALLPNSELPVVEQGQGGIVKKSSSSNAEREGEVVRTEKPPTKSHNLAVKQKAVYQPTLKHSRWLEQRKGMLVDDSRSISSIESNLSHLRGSVANIKDYVETLQLQDTGMHLDEFYGNVVLKKHKWNARKARDEEYRLIANRLLKLVGGSTGAKRAEGNKVVIGVGLGKFSTKTRLFFLHDSFQSFFVQKIPWVYRCRCERILHVQKVPRLRGVCWSG